MMNSVREISYKCKHMVQNREFFIIILIILVGFGSFGLGRLSQIEESKHPVQILYPKQDNGSSSTNQPASVLYSDTDIPKSNGSIVGSKNSSKYHYPWCSGAQRIKDENKVWFQTKEEAEKAGYTPAGNCKGLE